ncbi:MAG: TadE/TadG family type IV pilus assembly protein [Pseudomonadota bacterium]
MIRSFKTRLAAFRASENGAPTLEFALVFPAFMMMLMVAVELGVVNLRQIALESRLDSAMRVVRINTNVRYTHDDVRDMICQNADMFPDCASNLRLEMIPNDPRGYAQLPSTVDCVNSTVPINDAQNEVRNFSLGNANELVMVRACLLYDPVLPTSLLALTRTTDANGKSAHVAVSAFTQEPG